MQTPKFQLLPCVSHKSGTLSASPNASRWNIVRIGYFRVGIKLDMSISCCLSAVSLRWVAKANAVTDGIWA